MADFSKDPGFINTLTKQFSRDARQLIDQIETALLNKDYGEFRELAHALKGSSMMAGAIRSNPLAQDATSVAGRGDVPHNGIGGFFQLLPDDRPLAAPATITIRWLDEEVAGLDESSIRVYRWNGELGAWDLVGGVPDPANNRVVATIDRLALYTAAPAMPVRCTPSTWPGTASRCRPRSPCRRSGSSGCGPTSSTGVLPPRSSARSVDWQRDR